MGLRNILKLFTLLYLQSHLHESECLHGPEAHVAYRFFQFVAAFAHNDPSKTRQDNQFCLGSIISSKHVLTTASCLAGKDLGEIVVYSGARDLNQALPYGVQELMKYDPNQGGSNNQLLNLEYNDIAVAVLKERVSSEFVKKKPFKWVSVDSLEEHHYLLIGWGLDDRRDSCVFKTKIDVKLLDSELCKSVVKWRSVENGKYFCTSAGGLDSSLSPIDYGSPLLSSINHHQIVGVTVRRLLPSETGFHSSINVHANISYYKHFLQPYQLLNINEQKMSSHL